MPSLFSKKVTNYALNITTAQFLNFCFVVLKATTMQNVTSASNRRYNLRYSNLKGVSLHCPGSLTIQKTLRTWKSCIKKSEKCHRI